LAERRKCALFLISSKSPPFADISQLLSVQKLYPKLIRNIENSIKISKRKMPEKTPAKRVTALFSAAFL